MNNQLTVRLSGDEYQRLEQCHAIFHKEDKYKQSRSSILRRLIAIACDVVLESRDVLETA